MCIITGSLLGLALFYFYCVNIFQSLEEKSCKYAGIFFPIKCGDLDVLNDLFVSRFADQ